eukprot:TRINITY_DN32750_c0_g1_i1.p1 TRINITY_DN32750_c0_g1~~TRINITY_DN32750_c0_g1_i1.p1  ORF type:complete len:291 (-),score=47.10 TRINITY_DN32750_c0_g1_i1:328-1200(-)
MVLLGYGRSPRRDLDAVLGDIPVLDERLWEKLQPLHDADTFSDHIDRWDSFCFDVTAGYDMLRHKVRGLEELTEFFKQEISSLRQERQQLLGALADNRTTKRHLEDLLRDSAEQQRIMKRLSQDTMALKCSQQEQGGSCQRERVRQQEGSRQRERARPKLVVEKVMTINIMPKASLPPSALRCPDVEEVEDCRRQDCDVAALSPRLTVPLLSDSPEEYMASAAALRPAIDDPQKRACSLVPCEAGCVRDDPAVVAASDASETESLDVWYKVDWSEPEQIDWTTFTPQHAG